MRETSLLVHDLIHNATVFIGFRVQVRAVAVLHIYTTALVFVLKLPMIARPYVPRFSNIIDLLGEVRQVVRKANCYS